MSIAVVALQTFSYGNINLEGIYLKSPETTERVSGFTQYLGIKKFISTKWTSGVLRECEKINFIPVSSATRKHACESEIKA